jgi:hypothetical protein
VGSFIVACEVGKQGLGTCRKLLENVFDRVELPFPDNRLLIFSDGNDVVNGLEG